MQVEDSSENQNDDANGVDMSGLDTASTVHTDVVANGNEDEPKCEPCVLNETTDRYSSGQKKVSVTLPYRAV